MGALNSAQQEAVAHHTGPLLILAGAGAGKTRVIVERIATLIRGGIAPEKILAVTFTNKAAKEMEERVSKITNTDFRLSPWDQPRTTPFIGTFHALSLHILKSFHTDAGLPKRFTIYDRGDSARAAKEAIIASGFNPEELEPRRVVSAMGRAKGDALTPSEFRDRGHSYIDGAIAEVWERYDAILAKEHALDFDDILVKALRLLEKPSIRTHFQNAWEQIHVDEYQDTNRVQYEIIKAIAGDKMNVAVVGDADQNIYSWRGASLAHILNFERDFPGARVVTLTENYRSTKTILAAANDAIAKNVRRRDKTLTTINPEGEPISIAGADDEVGEARYVAHECARLIRRGTTADDIAVLYRANFQSRVLEEAFLHAGIEYQVLGTRFFERKEIKDALSYLRLALADDENPADLARVINVPARGIGKVGLAKILAGQDADLPAGQQQKLAAFRALIGKIKEIAHTAPASRAVRYAINESGMWALFEKETGEDEERLENLKELVTVASKYDTLPPGEGIARLIEEGALQSDQDELIKKREDKPGVKLMTIHAAKGLEFPIVFVTGLEEGLFPHEREDGVDDEEERRLFYVALTRAEIKVYLTYAVTRRIFGTRVVSVPSEFITEMSPALVKLETQYAQDIEDIIA